MLLEAALCLSLQQKELDASPDVQKGGVLTPASGERGRKTTVVVGWLGWLGKMHSAVPRAA